MSDIRGCARNWVHAAMKGQAPQAFQRLSGCPRPRTGRADQTAVVLRYARAAELALASRARRSRSPPAAGAAPVPP